MFRSYFDPWNASRGWSEDPYDVPARRTPYARPAARPAPAPAPVEPVPVRPVYVDPYGRYVDAYGRPVTPAPSDPFSKRSAPVDRLGRRPAPVDPFERRPVPPGLAERPSPVPIEPVAPRVAADPVVAAPEPAPEARPASLPPVEPPVEIATTDKAQVRRAMEELEASKRRIERDAERARDEARGAVIREMLPVLDNLDRSITARANTSDPALLEGIKLVREQFEGALARYGLERVESVGNRFDPSRHEAIGVVEVEDATLDGAVVDEWQRGYRLGDKLLRPAQVRVGRRREQAEA